MNQRRTILKIPIALLIGLFCATFFLSDQNTKLRKEDSTICYSCFWKYHPEKLKNSLTNFYKNYQSDDFFLAAEASYLMGRMIPDDSLIRTAFTKYKYALAVENDPFREMLLNEIIGMLADDLGIKSKVYFKRASKLAKKMKMKWRSNVLRSIAKEAFTPTFGDYEIAKDLSVPHNTTHFVLGQSSIKIKAGVRIGVQLERTFRDWLSSQLKYNFLDSYLLPRNVLQWHEGARLNDLMIYAGAVPVPLTGSLLAYKDGTWYAPDEKGIFRFKILIDKVQYPTSKQYGNVALMIDTHGISAIVEQAVREEVDLVVACGDNPAKAKAAAYLAEKGINVYFPCDREIGMLIGYEGSGMVLGTAPIRNMDFGAIIGNQPIQFSIEEPIVVQDITRDSVARYYDTSSRYFKALNSFVPLNLHTVSIESEKETYKVVKEAKRIKAKAIGVRVSYEEDYKVVKEWLQESKENRAVLFHSAPYKPGYRLFFEFPEQVTFGDPRPQFLSKE